MKQTAARPTRTPPVHNPTQPAVSIGVGARIQPTADRPSRRLDSHPNRVDTTRLTQPPNVASRNRRGKLSAIWPNRLPPSGYSKSSCGSAIEFSHATGSACFVTECRSHALSVCESEVRVDAVSPGFGTRTNVLPRVDFTGGRRENLKMLQRFPLHVHGKF